MQYFYVFHRKTIKIFLLYTQKTVRFFSVDRIFKSTNYLARVEYINELHTFLDILHTNFNIIILQIAFFFKMAATIKTLARILKMWIFHLTIANLTSECNQKKKI